MLSNLPFRARLEQHFLGLPLWFHLLFAIAALLAVLLVPVIWPDMPIKGPDSDLYYLPMAQDLLDGSLDAPYRSSIGYPLFLVAVGAANGPNRAVLLIQMLAYVVGVYLIAALLYR